MAAPILWTDRNHLAKSQRPARRWDPVTKTRVPVLKDDGDRAVERLPATGSVGAVREVADIANTRPMPQPRTIHVLRDDGHEVDPPIRAAAAAGHGENGSDNSFERYVRAKGKSKGWVVDYACPVDLVLRRELRPQQMRAVSVQDAIAKRDACGPRNANEPPCPHYFAEVEARRARRLAEHQSQVDRQKTTADKQTEALVTFVEKMVPQHGAASQADQEFAPVKKGPAK